MTKTFHIIEYSVATGRERIVGVVHQNRHESAGAERAVATAITISKIAGDGCYRIVREMTDIAREIAVVGANGLVVV